MNSLQYKGITISLIYGDITAEKTDAIVNAANEYLSHGAGVAGAISYRGGNAIQKESDEYVRKNGIVPVGSCGLTSAGNLPSKFVIHAVGPVFDSKNPQESQKLLFSAFSNTFKLAEEKKMHSISVPPISSGIFGYPKDECAKVLFLSIKEFADEREREKTPVKKKKENQNLSDSESNSAEHKDNESENEERKESFDQGTSNKKDESKRIESKLFQNENEAIKSDQTSQNKEDIMIQEVPFKKERAGSNQEESKTDEILINKESSSKNKKNVSAENDLQKEIPKSEKEKEKEKADNPPLTKNQKKILQKKKKKHEKKELVLKKEQEDINSEYNYQIKAENQKNMKMENSIEKIIQKIEESFISMNEVKNEENISKNENKVSEKDQNKALNESRKISTDSANPSKKQLEQKKEPELTEIRITIIDNETFKVFEKELKTIKEAGIEKIDRDILNKRKIKIERHEDSLVYLENVNAIVCYYSSKEKEHSICEDYKGYDNIKYKGLIEKTQEVERCVGPFFPGFTWATIIPKNYVILHVWTDGLKNVNEDLINIGQSLMNRVNYLGCLEKIALRIPSFFLNEEKGMEILSGCFEKFQNVEGLKKIILKRNEP